MSRYWNPDVGGLSPYSPGEQPKDGPDGALVKLNTNELPEGPSPRVMEAVCAAGEKLRLYPDPDNTRLREAWGADLGIPPSRVFPGNGSDEVLAHCFRALFRPELPVLFPDVSYSFYPVYSALYGLRGAPVPLAEDYSIDFAPYRRPNGGIVFANPNAPTGMATTLDHIRELLDFNRDSVVVVDEAYIDFGGESAVELISRHPQLLVVRSLSKSRGLAGLRVGAAFGQEHLVEGLERVKNSFNSYPVGRLAEAGAVAALQDREWFEAARGRVVANRETLRAGLVELGFRVLPSAANFLFVTHPDQEAAALHQALRERGILVRHFNGPRIERFLRVTVGATEECAALLAALGEIL